MRPFEPRPFETSARTSRLLLPAFVWLYALVLLFAGLGALPLVDPDEGRNASVSREVFESGSWLVPTYDGMPYLDKPIAYFKAVALSFSLFGVNRAAARLPSALCGLALLALLYVFCRRVYHERAALFAVLVLASSPLFFALSRTVIFDVPLTLFISASIFAVYLAQQKTGRSRLAWHAAGAFSAGVATLIKGPVGFLVPGCVLIVDQLFARRPGFFRRFFSPWSILALLAPVLPWFLALAHARPDFVSYGLVEESLRRYSTTSFNRAGPFWYYVPVLFLVFFPWSSALITAAPAVWRRRRGLSSPDRLFVVWAAVVLVFFSLSSSKLPGYILPAIIALAALMGRLAAAAIALREGDAARAIGRALLAFAVAAAALGLFLCANVIAPEFMRTTFDLNGPDFAKMRPVFAPVGIVFLVEAVLFIVAGRVRRTLAAVLLLAIVPGTFVAAGWSGIRVACGESSSERLVEAMGPLPADTRVVCLACQAPGLPFALGRRMTVVSETGNEFTSNYVLYGLRQGGPRPDVLVDPAQLGLLIDGRTQPVYLLSRKGWRAVIDSVGAVCGVRSRSIAPRWFGALLPATCARAQTAATRSGASPE